ncbi:Smr/MutS family protein [Microvirga sp. W0021]|uniref:Smr/MutS family protein n=1 Tax=Hohaiivirga grylli TaxID=3133970 RepID=A0ABV0BIK2_9HYPH
MSSKRSKRTLSYEERWLWAKVKSNYTPLKNNAMRADMKRLLKDMEPVEPNKPAQFDTGPEKLDQNTSKLAIGIQELRQKAPEPKKLPPIMPLERKTLRSVRRGSKAVDGVLDLHGMRQSEAHYALLSFLRQSQARGASLVLVITGKGESGSGFYRGAEERGVLKRVVPQWLSMPDVRPFVVSFNDAAQHHGGTGALYVKLRRNRG